MELVIKSDRPEWFDDAKCAGMMQAFTSGDAVEQKAVCMGTTYPGDTACPVRRECVSRFVNQVVKVSGMQLAYDNDLVHGGFDKHELLEMCKAVRKKLRQEGVQP